MEGKTLEDAEIDLLLEDLLEMYGYDFSDYARASLKRRMNRLFQLDRFPSFAEFRFKLRSDPEYLRRFVAEVSVNVTEMFRDPLFYRTLREEVLPVLATHPLIRIWHAGCATGEEVYSMAIMLKEANLLHKSLLYATDINPNALSKLKTGIFSAAPMRQYSDNYRMSGGKLDFSSYYTAHYDRVKFHDLLGQKIIASTHNLVSDSSFNEFQLILCRNVLIYFNKELQDRALELFDQSLESLGFLALGAKETVRFSSIAKKYRQLENKEKIWRKIV